MRVVGTISVKQRCWWRADEAKRSFDNGYAYFKLKVGGAPESTDLARIHAAIEVAGSPSLVAVDANGMLGGEGSSSRLDALRPLRAWLDRRACCSRF